jgi:hypothetical protein
MLPAPAPVPVRRDRLRSDAYGCCRSGSPNKGKECEIPRSADRDPRPLVHWYCCIWDTQTADYRRPFSRSRRELAGSVGQHQRTTAEAS